MLLEISQGKILPAFGAEMGDVISNRPISSPRTLLKSVVHPGSLRGCIKMHIFVGILCTIKQCGSRVLADSRGFYGGNSDQKGMRMWP